MRILELYCGIGGLAAAVGPAAEVVAAVDVNRRALEVYGRNFAHPTVAATLETLAGEAFRSRQADFWWLSPPCQPFTRRGHGRDDRDPRTRSLLRLIDQLAEAPPTYLGLENVPGFAGSRTHQRLRGVLDNLGYAVRECLLCPTELGVPNRRRRFYLVAGRQPLGPTAEAPVERRPLAGYLDPEPADDLFVDPGLTRRYQGALDIVDAGDPAAIAACFTSAYGRSPVRSGSYLAVPGGLRRLSPAEILRLLGFPASYTLPPDLPRSVAWRLAGNSLSVPAVHRILTAVPGLL